jgi:acyl-coenzyme A synthetase/AMP-(fatty) acid ligase
MMHSRTDPVVREYSCGLCVPRRRHHSAWIDNAIGVRLGDKAELQRCFLQREFVVQVPRDGERSDSRTLRVIAAALSPRLRAELRACLTNAVINAYASNEATDISLIDDNGNGTLYPGVSARIVDESGQDRRDGEPGIIMVRSPCMSACYLWNDDETRKHFIDGWFWSSGIGVMPKPGKLIVLGRSDDMLNVGGVKVAPCPIEERIKSIDGATDAAMVSHINQYGVEELHVVIECPDEAASVNEQLPAILDGYVTQMTIHFTTELPRTGSGKIRRNVLRDHSRQKLS